MVNNIYGADTTIDITGPDWLKTLSAPQSNPDVTCPVGYAPASEHTGDIQCSRNDEDIASQSRRVKAIFQKLTLKGMSETKMEGIRELNMLCGDFCGMLNNRPLNEQAIITSSIWARVLGPVMEQADTVRVVCAIINGRMANVTKQRIPHGEWLPFAREHYKGLSVRVIQENMRLAGMRNIENHCDKGLTRLNKLVLIAENPHFNSMEDPILGVFQYIGEHSDVSIDDVEMISQMAIADHKLKKAGLNIELVALKKHFECGYDLDGSDIKEMLAAKEKGIDPVSHIEAIAKYAGNRVFVHTTPKVRGKKTASSTTPDLPDINSLFVKTSEAINFAVQGGNVGPKEVNREFYEQLVTDLENFGKKIFSAA